MTVNAFTFATVYEAERKRTLNCETGEYYLNTLRSWRDSGRTAGAHMPQWLTFGTQIELRYVACAEI
jgi:hypothetical protein